MKGKHRWIRLIVLEHVNFRSCKNQHLPIAGLSQSENIRLTLPPSSPERYKSQMRQVYVQCWLITGRAVAQTVSWLTSVMCQPEKNLCLFRIALCELHFKIISGIVFHVKYFQGFLKASCFIHHLRLISVKFFFQGYGNVYWLEGCTRTSVSKFLTHLFVTFLLIFNIFELNKHQKINSGNTTTEYQSS